MSENNIPEFSISPLEGKPKKKTVRRKTTTTRRPRVVKKENTLKEILAENKNKKVGERLTAIYEDDNGKLPNMRTIELKTNHHLLGKLFAMVVVLGLITAAAWTGFFLMPSQKSLTTSEVSLKITGEENLTLGATTTITIAYQNNQKVTLQNAVLSIRYPESFTFLSSVPDAQNAGNTEWPLGTLSQRQKGEVVITGKMYAPLNAEQAWRVFLSYQPDNFQSELQTMATFENRVSSVPYGIKLTAPDKITTGADTTLTIKIENSTNNWPSQLRVVPIFPTNFHISSSTPKLAKDGWSVDQDTASATEFPITLTGKMSEQLDPTATFQAQLIWLDEDNKKLIIATNEISAELIKDSLSLAAAVNGSTGRVYSQPDDILGMTFTIKNNSTEDATNITLRVALDAPCYQRQSVLDWANLVDKNDGDVKGIQLTDTKRRGEITWTSKHFSQLKTIKAGQEVTLDISLPVKNLKGIDWNKVKESTATLTADVNFTTKGKTGQIITINPLEIVFNSDLSVEVRDEKVDADGLEQHKVTWLVTNTLHPLKDVSLSADIYGNTTVQLPDAPPAGKINYDSNAKRLVWEIPEINENMDVLALPFTVTINTKDPTQNVLVSKVRIQATDTVTGEQLDLMASEIGLKAE